MKIRCIKSGIVFEVSGFPGTTTGIHPCFSMPIKKLWHGISAWKSGTMPQVESYLLFLALADSTGLVEFHDSVDPSESTPQIVASQMPRLLRMITTISTVTIPSFKPPRFSISRNALSSDLSSVSGWITDVMDYHGEYVAGSKRQALRAAAERKQAGLERLIRSTRISPIKYANQLASWASDAAAFPADISDYWKSLIVRCHTDTDIVTIPKHDLIELLDHVTENLDAIGSVSSHHLFSVIQTGLDTIIGFFSGFAIITKESTADISEALLEEISQETNRTTTGKPPVRSDYKSDFAFLKAKMNYSISREGKK